MAKSTTQPDSTTNPQDEGTDPTDTGVAASEAVSTQTPPDQMLVRLVADPDIQAILTARREGREIKVVSNDGSDDSTSTSTAPPPTETLPDHIDEDAYGDFNDDMKRVVKALDKQISSKITPLVEEITALKSIAQGYEQREMNSQIATIASKHKDFDKYRKSMAALARAEGAGLGVEELFLLAKHRAGELSLDEPSTHSEKPTPTPRRRGSPHNKGDDKDRATSNRRRFQVTLADALENLNLPT